MTRLSVASRMSLLGAGLATFALLGVLIGSSIVSAQATTIDGGSWNFGEASTGNTVSIDLAGVPSAGLGAADISVAFDSAVLQITACDTGDLSGACNPNAPGGPAQAAGFAAPAISADPATIATFTFDCVGAAGTSSALTITVNELLDGTAGDAQAVTASVTNGTATCGTAALPPTGSTPPGDSSGAGNDWIIALAVSLAVVALGLGAFGAWRVRERV